MAKASSKASRIFGILGLATAILLVMFEIDNYRRTGQVAYFWLLVAIFMGVLGFCGIVAKPPPKG
jgi:phosphate/sulfate permease